VAEEYELAGVGVAYELGRRAYKQGMTIRDNPYSATREARKYDEWAKGLERGKHDANDARHFRSSVREQAVAEGLAQDEAEEYGGWRAEFVNEINYNTFEVKLTNSRSKESANFIVRPVDMVSNGPTLSIETMDVHDLQTGQTESWTNDDPAPDGPIAYAISGLFYDDKQLQKKLQNIIDTHDTKGQDMMPGLEKRRSIGQEVDADAYIDSQEKTQAAMAKMKKGVAEKLGDNRPKLGSKRDAGKSIRKWRSARGLDETGVAEGIEGEIAGGAIGGLVGAAAGSTLGPIGGAIGGALGSSAGGAIGSRYQDGKPLKEKQQLDEIAPLLAIGVRLFMAAAPKIAQVIGKTGRAGAQGAGQVAKSGAEIAAKNAGQIGLGAGIYEIGSSVANIAKDITTKVGTAVDEKTVVELATLAFKYAIPAGIVLAVLYGGKKAIDSLFSDDKQKPGVAEGKPKEKEADYGADYQDMVSRVKKLAGLGPLKTVYDPAKRVYRNVPTAVQPKR